MVGGMHVVSGGLGLGDGPVGAAAQPAGQAGLPLLPHRRALLHARPRRRGEAPPPRPPPAPAPPTPPRPPPPPPPGDAWPPPLLRHALRRLQEGAGRQDGRERHPAALQLVQVRSSSFTSSFTSSSTSSSASSTSSFSTSSSFFLLLLLCKIPCDTRPAQTVLLPLLPLRLLPRPPHRHHLQRGQAPTTITWLTCTKTCFTPIIPYHTNFFFKFKHTQSSIL